MAPGNLQPPISRLAPNWRIFFIPDQYRQGDFVCHSGRGTFRINHDLSVIGETETWIGGIAATLKGQAEPSGQVVGESFRNGVRGSQIKGRLHGERGSGTFHQFHGACQGTWVSEPKPGRGLTRPVYVAPKGCNFTDSLDLRFCDYTLADGTLRTVSFAQDIYNQHQFVAAFSGPPPGFDRPDLAQQALKLFVDHGTSQYRDQIEETKIILDRRDLPYGALACLLQSWRSTVSDLRDPLKEFRMTGYWCIQPMADGSTRFVALQLAERNSELKDDARFNQDARALHQSLRLP